MHNTIERGSFTTYFVLFLICTAVGTFAGKYYAISKERNNMIRQVHEAKDARTILHEIEESFRPKMVVCQPFQGPCGGADGRCYDFRHDNNNCGGCRIICSSRESCVNGYCVNTQEETVRIFKRLDNALDEFARRIHKFEQGQKSHQR